MTRVVYLAVGPRTHGVVRHGLSTAEHLGRLPGLDVSVRAFPDVEAFTAAHEEVARAARSGAVVHLDVTDALFGPDPASAADVLCTTLPASATVTLYDVPQPGEGPGRFARRGDAYAHIATHVAGVVVSSDHERALLADLVAVPTRVVPLPVPDGLVPGAPLPRELVGLERDVVVLGFLYPGKGHAEALDALAHLHAGEPPASGAALPTGVTALGKASPGHEDLVTDLTRRAQDAGLGFRVTGYVPDAVLPTALAAAGVPFAAHHNVSASGSLAAWTAAGRRALTPRGHYTAEMERLRPGTLTLIDTAGDPDGTVTATAAAIARAAAHPDTTWIPSGASREPGALACAELLVVAWASLRPGLGVPLASGKGASADVH